MLRTFGIDNRVARLNNEIDWYRDWSDPFLLSILIRRIVFPAKSCWLATKKSVSALAHSARERICMSCRSEHAEDDVESGERDGRGEEPEDCISESPAEKAKNEFRTSLETVFNNAYRVDEILEDVDLWEDEM